MSAKKSSNNDDYWIRGLVKFLSERGEVDAVLFDSEGKNISLATSGAVDKEELKKCLHETLTAIENGAKELGEVPEGYVVSEVSGKTMLEKGMPLKASRFWKWREFPWPEPEEVEKAVPHEEDWRFLSLMAMLCGVFAVVGYGLEQWGVVPVWVPVGFYIIAMVAGGYDAAVEVYHKIPKGELDIHFLMLAVAVGAVAIDAWEEGILLLFLFAASGAMEKLAQHRTRRAIDALFKAAPKTALVEQDGEEVEIPIERVVPGMVVVVKPGQQFPVDAEVISGDTAADESTLTGEAVPVDKTVGDEVSSGTMNLWGVVKARVLKAASESSLQKVINLIKEAQNLRAPSQRFTDKFGTPYTYFILAFTVVMFFVWWWGFGVTPFKNVTGSYSAFYRAMTLLVVASPCALVLSIPSAILAAIARGASSGILFKGGAAIEKLTEVDIVALDKTGTLTTGDLRVVKVESFPGGREEEVAAMAYSLEKSSTHPIARAIIGYGKHQGLEALEVKEFKSLTGSGIQGEIGGKLCVLGRRGLLEKGPLAEWAKELPETTEEFTEVWVVCEGLIGRMLLQDSIREQSKPVLEELKKLGLRTVMLTGDRRGTAESIGKQLGLQEVRAALKPEDKVGVIREFTEAGMKVAMVGDGVNDAPSLAASYVPVAMGARGSDAALEESEVVLMNDRIEYFLDAYRLSLRAKRVIRVNLGISLLAIITMVSGATMGLVPLTLGVLVHEGSTLLVCASSIRLLYKKKRKKEV